MLPNPPPPPPTLPIPPKLNVGASVDAAAPVPPVAVVKAPAPDAPPNENPNVLLGAADDDEEEDAAPPEAAVDEEEEEESPHRLAALPVFARILVGGRREVKDAVVEGGRTELENDVNCDKDDDDEGREEPKTSGG